MFVSPITNTAVLPSNTDLPLIPPPQILFSTVYNIVRKKSATVAMVFQTNRLNVAFRRYLVAANLIAWHQLVAMVSNVQLTSQKDTFIWSVQPNGKFTLRSMYRALCCTQWFATKAYHLETEIAFESENFYVVLNQRKRQSGKKAVEKGSLKCCFCNLNENIQHLYFDCQFC